MLTYAELKEAEALALETSRRTGGRPVAIIIRTVKRGWWDFSDKPWAVVAHTPDVPASAIIVGGICAQGSGS